MKLNNEEWETCYFNDDAVVPFQARQSRGGRRIFAIAVLILSFFSLLIILLCAIRVALKGRVAKDEPTSDVAVESCEEEWQGVFASSDISERCLSVCVSLRLGAVADYSAPAATGVVISSDGWILSGSNFLNTSQIGRYYAKFYDGSEYAVDKVKSFGDCGLVLMKIDASALTAAELGTIDRISVGQSVAAISSLGAPYHELAIRECILSGVGQASRALKNTRILRTDVEFCAAEIGSPVFDREGRVLGIALYENERFILPIDQIRDELENM